jgi:hypothetical protein
LIAAAAAAPANRPRDNARKVTNHYSQEITALCRDHEDGMMRFLSFPRINGKHIKTNPHN